jgi:hypothetical protein
MRSRKMMSGISVSSRRSAFSEVSAVSTVCPRPSKNTLVVSRKSLSSSTNMTVRVQLIA